MKRKDLIENIEGSRLKKQFLEAFLLQSTFIEGVLKKLVENDLYTTVTFPVLEKEFDKGNYTAESKQVNFITEKLLRQNLYEIIEYLNKVDIINNPLKRKLHFYRDKRNEVLHDLVGKMSKAEFEKELESLVTVGQEILNDKVLIKASDSIQRSEEFRDVLDDPVKLEEFLNRAKNN